MNPRFPPVVLVVIARRGARGRGPPVGREREEVADAVVVLGLVWADLR